MISALYIYVKNNSQSIVEKVAIKNKNSSTHPKLERSRTKALQQHKVPSCLKKTSKCKTLGSLQSLQNSTHILQFLWEGLET